MCVEAAWLQPTHEGHISRARSYVHAGTCFSNNGQRSPLFCSGPRLLGVDSLNELRREGSTDVRRLRATVVDAIKSDWTLILSY